MAVPSGFLGSCTADSDCLLDGLPTCMPAMCRSGECVATESTLATTAVGGYAFRFADSSAGSPFGGFERWTFTSGVGHVLLTNGRVRMWGFVSNTVDSSGRELVSGTEARTLSVNIVLRQVPGNQPEGIPQGNRHPDWRFYDLESASMTVVAAGDPGTIGSVMDIERRPWTPLFQVGTGANTVTDGLGVAGWVRWRPRGTTAWRRGYVRAQLDHCTDVLLQNGLLAAAPAVSTSDLLHGSSCGCDADVSALAPHLVAHFDATSLSVLPGSSLVTRWSNTAYGATQLSLTPAPGGDMPTVQDEGVCRSVRFNGAGGLRTDPKLTTELVDVAQDFTYITVLRMDGDAPSDSTAVDVSGVQVKRHGVRPEMQSLYKANGGWQVSAQFPAPTNVGEGFAVVVTRKTDDELCVFSSTAAGTSHTCVPATMERVQHAAAVVIGDADDQDGQAFVGNVAEVLLFAAAASDDDVAALSACLVAKYDCTGSCAGTTPAVRHAAAVSDDPLPFKACGTVQELTAPRDAPSSPRVVQASANAGTKGANMATEPHVDGEDLVFSVEMPVLRNADGSNRARHVASLSFTSPGDRWCDVSPGVSPEHAFWTRHTAGCAEVWTARIPIAVLHVRCGFAVLPGVEDGEVYFNFGRGSTPAWRLSNVLTVKVVDVHTQNGQLPHIHERTSAFLLTVYVPVRVAPCATGFVCICFPHLAHFWGFVGFTLCVFVVVSAALGHGDGLPCAGSTPWSGHQCRHYQQRPHRQRPRVPWLHHVPAHHHRRPDAQSIWPSPLHRQLHRGLGTWHVFFDGDGRVGVVRLL